MAEFHDVRFPLGPALGARGGPERRTEVVTLRSGREERNALWAHSRRRWNAGAGLTSKAELEAVIAFFEARLGRLHAFRFRDPLDHSSAPAGASPTPFDQAIGVGDGVGTVFPLIKTYESGPTTYERLITRPVVGTVVAGVDGVPVPLSSVDDATGAITLAAAPPDGAAVTAGFLFDTPARFDTDILDIDLAAFEAGEIPDIPLVEVRA